MQQHEIAGIGLAQRIEHRIDPDHVFLRVVIGVRDELEPGAAQQGNMIGPGRIRHPHLRIGARPQDQAGRNAQAAGAARGLDRTQAIGIACVAERQVLHPRIELRIARRADIGLAVLRIDDALLGLLDDVEDRRFPLRCAKHADAEIDLLGTRVVLMLGDQSEDGVGRRGLQGFKHNEAPMEMEWQGPDRLYKRKRRHRSRRFVADASGSIRLWEPRPSTSRFALTALPGNSWHGRHSSPSSPLMS